jgi:hypothetical protein
MSDDANQQLLSKADELFQTLVIGDKRLVLSAEDLLTVGIGTDVSDDYSAQDVYLYAESMLFSSSLRFKSGVLSSYSVLPTPGSVFSTSGAKGEAAEARKPPTTDGEGGKTAGMMRWYSEYFDPDKPYLELAARGGDGGEGKQALGSDPGGNGGDGGAGGKVLAVIVHPYLRLFDRLLAIYKDTNETRKRGDLKLVVASMEGTQALNPVRMKLQSALAGTVDTLNRTLREAGLQLQTMVETWRATFKIDVAGGAYGVWGKGNPAGNNGKPGGPGEAKVVLARSTADLASATLDPFFMIHPVQCSLVLERLKLAYFSADPVKNPDGVTSLASSLRRLRDRTELFTTLAADHAIAKYYADHEDEFGALNSVVALKSLNTNAKRLLDQITNGLDYFGMASNDVPLASFSYYGGSGGDSGLLDKQIALFKTIETAYDVAYDELKSNKAKMDAIRASREQQRQLITNTENDITALRTTLHSVGDVIDSYQVTLPPMKKKIVDKLTEIEDKIKDHFDFNPKSFLSSLSLLAFAPESKLMWGVVIAQTAVSGVTEITDDQGDQVNKDYLVRQLKTIDGSLSSIDEGYKALDDGQLKADDPDAGKLLALEDTLTSTLDKYYNQFPDDLTELKTQYKAYVDAVMARNEQILKYNAIVILLARKHDAVKQARDTLASLADETLDNLKPDLPALTSFVSQTYYASRNLVMETLAKTARSYRFWALSDQNLIALAYQGQSLPKIDSAALAAAQLQILTAHEAAVNAFGSDLAPFPDSDSRKGVIFELNADQVETFKSGQVTVPVPLADRHARLKDNPFADMANVRLLVVRVWVDGATSADGNITLDITHTGSEKIVNRDGLIFSFSHDTKDAQFRYSLADNSIQLDGQIGKVTFAGSNTPEWKSTYALVGPFTYWQIEARDQANDELDLSNVTGVRMEFRGLKQRLR